MLHLRRGVQIGRLLLCGRFHNRPEAPSPETTTEELVEMAQQEIDLYAGLAGAIRGHISPVVDKNSWYLIEFAWDRQGKCRIVEKEAELWVDTAGRGDIPSHVFPA